MEYVELQTLYNKNEKISSEILLLVVCEIIESLTTGLWERSRECVGVY